MEREQPLLLPRSRDAWTECRFLLRDVSPQHHACLHFRWCHVSSRCCALAFLSNCDALASWRLTPLLELRCQSFGRLLSEFLTPFSISLSTIMLIFWAATAMTEPGILPRPPPHTEPAQPPPDALTGRPLELCRLCNVYKPPRTVHCRECNNCVAVFDHHCAWIGSCVGVRNRRVFVCFLASATLLSFTILLAMSYRVALILIGSSRLR